MGRSNLKIREKVKQREDNAYERVLKSVKSDIKSILGGTSNSKETWEAICLQHENSARTDSELMVEFYNIKIEPGMTIDQKNGQFGYDQRAKDSIWCTNRPRWGINRG